MGKLKGQASMAESDHVPGSFGWARTCGRVSSDRVGCGKGSGKAGSCKECSGQTSIFLWDAGTLSPGDFQFGR